MLRETKEIAELSKRYLQLPLEIGLPSDIDRQIQQNKQQIELPSVKYPQEYQIGYWRSSYGGGGIDTVLKTTIGSDLYDAFPKAKGQGTYLKPNWDKSLQMLQNMLIQFQCQGFEDQNFLNVTGFSIELGKNFVATLTPSNPERQALLTELEDCFTPQYQFNDYVKELEVIINTPDTFFNGSIRLSELAFRGLSYFFKVSSTPDIELKILTRTG